jgi:hypothetical protein
MSKLVGYNGFFAVIEPTKDDTDLDIRDKFIEIAKNNSIEDISEMKLEDITIEDCDIMPTNKVTKCLELTEKLLIFVYQSLTITITR